MDLYPPPFVEGPYRSPMTSWSEREGYDRVARGIPNLAIQIRVEEDHERPLVAREGVLEKDLGR